MSTQTRAFIRVKLKVATNEKRKKLLGFSFSINIANFEVFLQVKKLSANLFFLKSGLSFPCAGLSISILQIVEDRLLGPENRILDYYRFLFKKIGIYLIKSKNLQGAQVVSVNSGYAGYARILSEIVHEKPHEDKSFIP